MIPAKLAIIFMLPLPWFPPFWNVLSHFPADLVALNSIPQLLNSLIAQISAWLLTTPGSCDWRVSSSKKPYIHTSFTEWSSLLVSSGTTKPMGSFLREERFLQKSTLWRSWYRKKLLLSQPGKRERDIPLRNFRSLNWPLVLFSMPPRLSFCLQTPTWDVQSLHRGIHLHLQQRGLALPVHTLRMCWWMSDQRADP